jgi:hypothetical protein
VVQSQVHLPLEVVRVFPVWPSIHREFRPGGAVVQSQGHLPLVVVRVQHQHTAPRGRRFMFSGTPCLNRSPACITCSIVISLRTVSKSIPGTVVPDSPTVWLGVRAAFRSLSSP